MEAYLVRTIQLGCTVEAYLVRTIQLGCTVEAYLVRTIQLGCTVCNDESYRVHLICIDAT